MSPLLRLAASALLVLSACASGREHAPAASGVPEALLGPPPSVVGTTLDAATGRPLAGVLVRGPTGVETRSDEHGRFVLAGLSLGAAGVVEASAPDGRKGRIELRPLQPGALEVVLFVR